MSSLNTRPWLARNALKRAIRNFFAQKEYIEVDTPIAVTSPGMEVYLDYFETKWIDHQKTSHTVYLRSSPEIHMKQVITNDMPRVFQIATCFRNNGEISQWHHPEFTMLEWYQAHIEFHDFIDQTISLISHCQAYVLQALKMDYVDFEISSPKKITVKKAFEEFAGIELKDQDPALARIASEKKIHSVNSDDDFDTAYFKILLDKIEPQLEKMGLVVLYDFLPSHAALAKVEDGVAKRFEIYWRGVELTNGFSELIDAKENLQRFEKTNETRKTLSKQIPESDQYFFDSLKKGIPNCCGNALGFDRLLALILNKPDINSVIPFRHQMPFSKDKYQ